MLASDTLAFLLISLFAQALIPLLTRGFYAYQNTKIPLITGFFSSIVSLGLAWYLAVHLAWGVKGIAAGFSAGMLLNAILLYVLMSRHCGRSLLDWFTILKIIFASFVMFVVTWFVKNQWMYEGGFLQKLSLLLLIFGLGILVYVGLAKILTIPERIMFLKKK